jgi:hypothetical protein
MIGYKIFKKDFVPLIDGIFIKLIHTLLKILTFIL